MADAFAIELAVEGAASVPLELSAKAGSAIELSGSTIRFAVGAEATYLSTAGGRVTTPPIGARRIELVRGAVHRLTVELSRAGDGEAVLWMVEFAGGNKVASHTCRLDGARVALTWTADPRCESALLAIRVRGTGTLTIERMHLQKLDIPALPESPAEISEAPALPVVAPLVLHERYDRDREFAVLQLELLWQKGLLGSVDLGVVREPPAPRIASWLERSQTPARCRVETRADATAIETHLLSGGTSPIVVELGAPAPWHATWLASHERLHPVSAMSALDARTRRRRAHALAHPDLLAFRPLPETASECQAQGFEIVPVADLPTTEFTGAKEFWKDYGVRSWYQVDKPWTGWLAKWVRDIGAKRVLEFGCNVGRNLAGIRDLCPDVELVGIDINAEAIASGREHTGLDLRVADEDGLSKFETGSFDAVFTVSVLDHMSEIDTVCRELLRVASRHALFFEVRLPVEGRVDRHFDHKAGAIRPSTGASYSWHVDRRLDTTRLSQLTVLPTYLHSAALGPYYAAYFASLHARS